MGAKSHPQFAWAFACSGRSAYHAGSGLVSARRKIKAMWGKLAAAAPTNQLMQDPLYSITSSKPTAFYISTSLSCSADACLMLGPHLPILRQTPWHLAAQTYDAFSSLEPMHPQCSFDIRDFLDSDIEICTSSKQNGILLRQRLPLIRAKPEK